MSIYKALAKRFKPPEWAMFREVGNATGSNCRRHADAVAINLWPSRGMEVVGVEVKVSRSDWTRERDNPEKAEAVMQYCDRWYLAVSDAKIVRADEVPATWGLMVQSGDTMRVVKEAPKLEPKPLSKSFIAACLRRAFEEDPETKAIEAARREGWSKGHEEGIEFQKRNATFEEKSYAALLKTVQEFEAASGLRLGQYSNGKELGELVALLGKITSGDGSRSNMNAIHVEANNIRKRVDEIDAAIGAIREKLR